MASVDSVEPVWIQACLLEKHLAETAAVLGGQRRVSPSSANKGSSRKSNHRDNQSESTSTGGGGWGWLFGYASIESTDNSATKAIGAYSTSSSSSTSTSTGGQDRPIIRKVPHTPSPSASPNTTSFKSPSNKNVSSWNNRNNGHQDSPRTLRIHDEFNTKYNQTVFTVSYQEYRTHVLPANVTNASNNGDMNSTHNTTFIPPKNLIDLIHLHEPSLVHSLNIRYTLDKVYTNCGPILLALNPFTHLQGLYGDEVIQKYRHCSLHTFDASSNTSSVYEGVEPHIYAIADAAFLAMQASITQSLEQTRVHGIKRSNHTMASTFKVIPMDQSILISGESGAGKTYNTKMAMRYLASISQHIASSNTSSSSNTLNIQSSPKSMEQQVLQSNPILESFGNARTLRNDNSSRFGKLIDIKFHYSGYILGSSIDTYLLEKVRLVRQAPGERNYHIFYQLLMGMKDTKKRKELGIQQVTVENFKITCMSGTFDRRDGVCDVSTYNELLQAFDTVGFSLAEQDQLFHVIAGLLHMSNVNFYENATLSDSSTVNTKNPSLVHVLHLFGVQIQSLTQALCTCALTVRGETMIKNLNVDKAEKAKEALMKATYGALFEHIVQRVNQSTATGLYHHSTDHSVGIHDNAHIKILDIFGFESFHINSFEQLCINYCNEALQQQFNRFVFKMEQEEYEREGIDWSFIEFPDNQDILDLIERKHVGILSLLDEQCRLAKCSDQTFASATYEKCVDHPRFSSDKRQQASGLFQIQHYAGPVEYSTVSFLDKNKDELPREATDFLLSSSMDLLKQLGQRLNEKNNCKSINNNAQKSVGSQFSTQLRELRDQIDKTNPHYVRCLKPNDDLVAGNFIPEVVADQLRAAGVLEAVRVSRIGFPQRYKHDMFIQRYGLLATPSIRKAGKRSRSSDYCSMLVQDLLPRLKGSHSAKEKSFALGIQMGSTKVFLRQFAFDSLEKLRTQKLSSAATRIQCTIRMFLCKFFYLNLKSSIIIIQKTYRMFVAKKIVRMLRREWASKKIQSLWRGYVCFSDFSKTLFAIMWAQRTYRGIKVRKVYRILHQEAKAIIVQSWWRMAMYRKWLVLKRYIAFNMQQLYRCRKSKRILRELKIESRSLSKIVKERDELKKELQWMRQELEVAKSASRVNSNISVLNSVDKMCARNPSSVGRGDLANDSECAISSVCDENLISKIHRKDKEIELLRREIDFLKKPRSKDASMTEISTTDISLLDYEDPCLEQMNLSQGVNPHRLFEEEPHEECEISGLSFSFENHIHLAVHASDEDALSEAVSCAVDVTCDVNQGGLFGRTPLHIAVMKSNLAIVGLLLDNECITNAQDELGNTPLHFATSESVAKVLLEKGKCNPNIPNNEGWCCLHNAVKRLDAELCQTLLRHGSNVNIADHSRWLTPLHVLMITSTTAQSNNQISLGVFEITKLLCEQEKLLVDEQDHDGNTPLHYASTATHDNSGDVINQLLRRGANPNIVNCRGQSPLHLWLHNQQVSSLPFFDETILLLLKYGADVNSRSKSGCTPLHLAVYHGYLKIATLFLSEAKGQLHIPWRKPESWRSHWDSSGSSETLCLDMTQEIRMLIHAIRCKQTFAAQRPCCMHCKSESRGILRRQVNCEHCGSRICSSCMGKGKMDSSYLPSYCVYDPTSKLIVCKICQDLLINAKNRVS